MLFENAMRLGEVADDLDSLIAALAVPLPGAKQVEAIRASLPAQRDALRAVFVSETGEDPWD
jgi:hypothetical protein